MPASSRTADSIQAAQAIGSATEIVPDTSARPAPAPALGDLGGLPVRVRQANLAPQLREPGTPAAGPFEAPAPTSADALRSSMSAMQRGWERGRSAVESGDVPATYDPSAPEHRVNHEEA
jgi:hypothetical protein